VTWTCEVTEKQAAEINKLIKAIDADAVFIRHYAAGNNCHGWLERPDDGTNDYDHVRANKLEMRRIAGVVLGHEPKR